MKPPLAGLLYKRFTTKCAKDTKRKIEKKGIRQNMNIQHFPKGYLAAQQGMFNEQVRGKICVCKTCFAELAHPTKLFIEMERPGG